MLTTAPASAQQTAACRISAGSVTERGNQRIQTFAATRPITRTENRTIASGLWPPGTVRLSSSWLKGPGADTPDNSHRGLVVVGGMLHSSWYTVTPSGPYRIENPIGGGWGSYRAVELSQVMLTSTTHRQAAYGLASDGTLRRWNVRTIGGRQTWQPTGSAGGYAGVKSMMLISQTKTYDTFLMNGRDGALLTVHIPTTSPMKPIVKKVKTSTWQGFEAMVAARCGNYGTLLLGIDRDSGAGYLYAVGHGATVIQGLGKVPGSFTDPVNFGWHMDSDPPLFGE